MSFGGGGRSGAFVPLIPLPLAPVTRSITNWVACETGVCVLSVGLSVAVQYGFNLKQFVRRMLAETPASRRATPLKWPPTTWSEAMHRPASSA